MYLFHTVYNGNFCKARAYHIMIAMYKSCSKFFLGETYSTNIGFDECTDIEDITIPSKEFSVDSSSLIVFDLETTGLG